MAPASAASSFAPNLALDDPSLYINRELSWLEFNQRVLDQALDDYHPLLERVKFLAIVGVEPRRVLHGPGRDAAARSSAPGIEQMSIDGMTVAEQLAAIRQRAAVMMQRSGRPAGTSGCARRWPNTASDSSSATSTRRQVAALPRRRISAREIFPLLTPLAFDPGHPFPLISNRSKNFAVVVRHGRRTKFARVKVPPTAAALHPLSRTRRRPARGHDLRVSRRRHSREPRRSCSPASSVVGAHLFRVIRDTDIEVPDDGADDLLESMDRTLKQLRHGAAVAAAGRSRDAAAGAEHAGRELRDRGRHRRPHAPSGSTSRTGWRCTSCRCRT